MLAPDLANNLTTCLILIHCKSLCCNHSLLHVKLIMCAGTGRKAACSEMLGQGPCLPCRSWSKAVPSKLLPPMLFWLWQHPVSNSVGGALGRCLQRYCIISGFVCTSCPFCNLSLALCFIRKLFAPFLQGTKHPWAGHGVGVPAGTCRSVQLTEIPSGEHASSRWLNGTACMAGCVVTACK